MDKIKLYNWLKLLGIYLAILTAIYIIFLAKSILFPFFLAFILTYMLNPVADFFENKGLKRGFVVGLLFFFFAAALGCVVYFSAPFLLKEVNNLQISVPKNLLNFENLLKQASGGLENKFSYLPKDFLPNLFNEKYRELTKNAMAYMPEFIFSLVDVVTAILVVLFTTFYLLKDGRVMRKRLISIIPNKYFELFLCLLHEVNLQVGNYVRGQLTDCVIIGALSIAGLYIIGFKYSLLLGLIIGAINIIPYLGPLTGMLAGFLMAVLEDHSLPMGLKVLLVLALVKLIDDFFVNPVVVGKSVELHPLVVIVCIVVGGTLMGVFGMFISVPLFCALKATFKVLYNGIIEYGSWETAPARLE